MNAYPTLCRLAGAASLAFAATIGGSVSAQQAPPPVVAASFPDALNRAVAELSTGKLPQARTAFEALLERPLDSSQRGIVLAMRAVTLVGLGELDAAAKGFDEARLAAPNIPDVQLAEVRAGLAFGRPRFVLGPLTRIADAHGGWLTLDHREMVTTALAMGVQGKLREDYEVLVLALARADYGASDLNLRWDLAREAAMIAMARGDSALAASFVARIEDRGQIETILTDRRFSASWPQIEAAVGPHMATLESAAIESARKIATRGEDSVSLQALVRAYRLAGRYDEGDAVGVRIAPAGADLSRLSERDAWAVDEHASLLVAMERFEDADRRWAALTAIDLNRNPWLIGMILNRAAARVTQRNWAAADPLIDVVGTRYWKYASPFARQMIRGMQVCQAQARAQGALRDAKIAELLAHLADSRDLTIDALLCAGRSDEAARILVAWLNSGEKVEDAIGRLQPAGSYRSQAAAARDEPWRAMLARPEVQAAFDRVGRALPASLWPAVSSLRSR